MNNYKLRIKNPGEKFSRIFLTALLAVMAQFVVAQNKTVTGVIMDHTGEPVIGANIIEKGTTNGTITDYDGNFTLGSLSENSVLVIRYIGYNEQEVMVAGKSQFTIRLQESTEMLEEVVIVGYGAQKKESVVGAISQVSTKDLLSTPAANVSQAIAGKIPGVVTSQTSGAPGADDTQIFIRGRATFAGDGQPLILVDGIERPFSQIAPDDIETISVLKDASATAVYGVRGANGVMLITTKRGKEQKPEVSLTANWQVQSPTRRDTYLNSYESVKLLEEALANDGLPSQYSQSDIEMYRKSSLGQLSGIDAMLYPDVDWYDEVLKKSAPAQRYNVSIRGGTKRMRYYASGEVYDQSSLVKNLSNDAYGNSSSPHFRRYAFRANTDFFLTKDLTFSINFGTRFEERRGSVLNETSTHSGTYSLLNHTPGWIFPVSYEIDNGESIRTLYGGSSQYQTNVVAELAQGGYMRESNTINETNFIVDYKLDWITPGLSAKGMLSFDYENYHRNFYIRPYVATYELNDRDNYNDIDAYNRFNLDSELELRHSFETKYKLYMEAQVNYARKFGVHDVTAMALYMQNDYRFKSDLAERYQGVVGRVTYGYDDRYLAEFNAGYNGSENFAKGNRFGFFPSFSVGWRLSNEKFMERTAEWLTNAKIRASYGQVGNDIYKVNNIKQRFLYEQKWLQIGGDYRFGTTGVTGIYESQYPNFAVTWERAHKYNVGFEFGLLGKLNGVVDVFYEKRNDILTNYLTRPEWVGVTMAAGNLGETKNKGYEIELKYADNIGSDFYYSLGVTYSHARNEILYKDEPTLMTDYRKTEGHPIGQYFGLVAEGFVTQADLDSGNLPVSTFGDVKVGDLKYRDMNGDGFIDERDETFIGYSDVPENSYAINLGLNYKNWGFSIMFQGVDHVSRYYDAEAQFAFLSGGKVKEHHLGRWDPSQSEAYNLANATYPLLHYDSYGDHNQRSNSFFLKNGAFWRLKNIELSYTLPSHWSKVVGMSDCRLYFNANNLITWDKLDGLVDPESNGSNKYPIMKAVNFGVNIKF